MADGLILETTFLIDLERELNAGSPGAAQQFLTEHESSSLFTTSTMAGEMAVGFALDTRTRWEQYIEPFKVLPCTTDVCWQYGQAFRYLQANGLLIGANDLWIAATGLAFEKPVVTKNERHYGRVPGLRVLTY
jgi:predicted nucleic acid-binding protein